MLDAKLRILGRPDLGTSNPGVATTGVGGVGRNVAENLSRLGTAATLVAPVGTDAAADSVLGRTRAAGVDCEHVVTSPHPTGTYTAVLDDAGDLLVAVADMRATDELTVEDLGAVPALLDGSDLLVLDANPPAPTLRWLLTAAAEAGVPVVLEPVSVAKGRAVAEVLDGSTPVHTVTPNVDELGALLGEPVGDREEDVVAAAARLHARGVAHVWVRRGAMGSLLSVRDGGTTRVGSASVTAPTGARVVRVAAPPTEVEDVTGAGDAMTAGYVHALLSGDDVVEAVRFGQVLAALTCASAHTVRPDLTAALVAARLTPTEPSAEELPR